MRVQANVRCNVPFSPAMSVINVSMTGAAVVTRLLEGDVDPFGMRWLNVFADQAYGSRLDTRDVRT